MRGNSVTKKKIFITAGLLVVVLTALSGFLALRWSPELRAKIKPIARAAAAAVEAEGWDGGLVKKIAHSRRKASAFDILREMTVERPAAPVKPHGKLTVFPLDDRNIVVAGNYYDFIDERLRAEHGKRLSAAEKFNREGKLPDWSLQFWNKYAVLDIESIYHPQIRDNFERKDYFQLSSSSVKPLEVVENGSWINALGLYHLKTDSGRTVETLGSDLAHFAYLRFDRPLENGEKIDIVTENGEQVSFVWSDEKSVSRAIKINQVGYLPDAGLKYAYLGMWLGTLGELPVADRVGGPFVLREAKTGNVVFTGALALRSPEQYIERYGIKAKLMGETVLELDFSEFNTPGSYYIQVPGVGRSWDFEISPEVVARSFYVHMRGLFQQRSGIAKPKKYTAWNFDTPDHVGSWRGGFAPDDRQYSVKSGAIVGADGQPAKVKHFEMVKATATEEFLPEVYGGWWDAGDFDRRIYHFQVVDRLLSVYLLFPQNFSDSQLDIPESGNRIPDLIDEAAWGVEVWRRAQLPSGGVGCWLEATSHPRDSNPETDVQRYYTALPTRASTLEYAAYAAKLARAYKACGAFDKSELFKESALRAWNYAMDSQNRIIQEFEIENKGKFVYTEPEKLPDDILYKAAINLFMLTEDSDFSSYLTAKRFEYTLSQAKLAMNPWLLCELQESDVPSELPVGAWRKFLLSQADTLLASQSELAYRNINWPLKSGYFTYLAWGAGLPLRRGAFLILAWQLTGRMEYRDAALLLIDWMQGANPMGRSMTTGLGVVSPVRLHCQYGSVRGYDDPVPGITPYTFTGEVHIASVWRIFAIREAARKDHEFAGVNVMLLPHVISDGAELSDRELRLKLLAEIPLWRRFASLEGLAVDQNEYTVWETIAPAAAACAALLPPGWKPPEDWHEKQPEPDIEKLPGYLFLP